MATATLKQAGSGVLTITLAAEDGTPIPLANITTITLTLYDVATGKVPAGIINSRNAVSIKNVNGGTIADGGGTFKLTAADNAMVSTTAQSELHAALVEFTCTDGTAGWALERFAVERKP
jgi:hypothetical protein